MADGSHDGHGRKSRMVRPLEVTASPLRQQLHDLRNTLASLRLRLGLLAADRDCMAVQGDNIAALLLIADDALEEARSLKVADAAPSTRASRPRRIRPKAGRI